MRIIIPGKPIPKKRPKFARRGGFVATYDPQEKEKKAVKKIMTDQLVSCLNSEVKSISLDAGIICRSNIFHVEFTFFLPLNSSDSVKDQNKKLWGITKANCKPDYDNLEKFYLDCANGILWTDDASIIAASAKKLYSDNPRVEIVVKPQDEIKLNEKVERIISFLSPNELTEMVEHAKKLSQIPEPSMEDVQRDFLVQWFTTTACILSDFALKFADKFTKIKKVGNVTEEIKARKDYMQDLEKGVFNF